MLDYKSTIFHIFPHFCFWKYTFLCVAKSELKQWIALKKINNETFKYTESLLFFPLTHITCKRSDQIVTNDDEAFTFAIPAVLCKSSRVFTLALRKAFSSSSSNTLNLALLMKKKTVEKSCILFCVKNWKLIVQKM